MTSGGLPRSRLPRRLPAALTLTQVSMTWWRLEHEGPSAWSWEPFPTPLHRFDSAAGMVRVRYAAASARGAARERFDPDRRIGAADSDLRLVELVGTLEVVDLRDERILDALHLDDRISTARDSTTLQTCHELGDRLRSWYGGDLHGIGYRSRTTPETSANLAWHAPATLSPVATVRLGELPDLLGRLVLLDRFTVDLPF